MTKGRKTALAMLAVAWVALGVAFLGVFFTPRNYCNELPTPTGQLVTWVGLPVALGAAVLGAFILTIEESIRGWFVALGVGLATIAAGAGVAIFAAHHTAAWGCG